MYISSAFCISCMSAIRFASRALARAVLTLVMTTVDKIPMMAMTTKSSSSVKPAD
jgi:hypothetical protein